MSSAVPNIPPPAEQIRSLMEMEHRIPRLLTLLSSALTALLPPDPDAPKVVHDDGSVQEEEERFVDSAKDYYQELDDVQLLLRSTIHHLRLTRVLPTPGDFVPPPPNQLPPTPFSAPIPKLPSPTHPSPADSESSQPIALAATSTSPSSSSQASPLGLHGLRVEAGSWRRLRDSLREMKGLPPAGEDSGLGLTAPGEREVDQTIASVEEDPSGPAAETSREEKEGKEDEDEDEGMEEVKENDVPAAEADPEPGEEETGMEVDGVEQRDATPKVEGE